MKPRDLALALLAAVVVGLGAVAAWRLAGPPAPSAPRVELGGPFALVTQDGRAFTDRDLRGKPAAIFFGFTTCPEVCPTTLSQWTATLKAMGADADRLRPVFVTVDPERDTPQALHRYLSDFDPRIVGLTGSPEAVKRMLDGYHVYAKRVPIEGGGYTMDHTAATFLFDRNGGFQGLIGYPVAPSDLKGKLEALAHGRAPA